MNSLFQNQNGAFNPPQSGKLTPQQVIGLIRNSGKTPEQIINSMLENGTLSREEFERYRMIANRTLGTNF